MIEVNEYFLKLYINLCQKFKSKPILFKNKNQKLELKRIGFIYGITNEQIKKANFLILFCLTLFFFILFIFLPKSTGFLFFSLTSYFILYFDINNILLIEIKKQENKNIDSYRFFLLYITIYSQIIHKSENFLVHIINFFGYFPTLGINTSKKIQEILFGASIKEKLMEIKFFSQEFNYLFHHLISANNINKNHSLIDEFEEKLLYRFEVFLSKFETHLQILTFITIFYPILFFFANLFYIQSTLDRLSFLSIFLMILVFLEKRWIISFPVIITENNSRHHELTLLEIIKFLEKMSYYLQFSSAQFALLESIQNSTFKNISERNLVKIYLSFNPISKFFDLLKKKGKDQKISIILETFLQILNRNSERSIDFYYILNHIFKQHLKIEKKKNLIQKEIKIKSNTFKFISTIILSILSVFIFIFRSILSKSELYLQNTLNFSAVRTNYLGIEGIFLISLYFLIVILFSFNRMTSQNKFQKIDLFFIIFFIILFFSTKSLIFINIL